MIHLTRNGTLDDARLSANVPRLNVANTFSENTTIGNNGGWNRQLRVLKFALRDASTPNAVYLEGIASVTRAAQVD